MFLIESGRLELAPPAAAVGDAVCVVYGGDVPYVLRPADHEEWGFVGEWYVLSIVEAVDTDRVCSYLHGMMDGQALESQASEEVFRVLD